MTPGYARTRSQLPHLYYPKADTMRVINAHRGGGSGIGFGNEIVLFRGPSGTTNLGSGPDATYYGPNMSVVSDTNHGGVSAFYYGGSSNLRCDSLDITSLTQCSWGMWLRGNGSTVGTRWFSLQHSSGDDIRIWESVSDHVAVDDGTTYSAEVSITHSVWTHVVGTFDGSTVRGYLNGVLESTTPGATFDFSTATGSLAIGASAQDNSLRANDGSKTDDIRFLPSVLTATQIANWYSAGRGYNE